jgi:hypothetical protein
MLHPCKIETLGRWGASLKHYFKSTLKPSLELKAKHQQNDQVILQWKKRFAMGMFKSVADHLDSRVQEIMTRNRVADQANAGIKPVSDEVQEQIDYFGALTFVSTVKGLQSPFSVA